MLRPLALLDDAIDNDTYTLAYTLAYDIDSPLKTFVATLSVPHHPEVKAGQPIAATGYAHVGISGLSKVQVFLTRGR